jgi:hypothetical protein
MHSQSSVVAESTLRLDIKNDISPPKFIYLAAVCTGYCYPVHSKASFYSSRDSLLPTSRPMLHLASRASLLPAYKPMYIIPIILRSSFPSLYLPEQRSRAPEAGQRACISCMARCGLVEFDNLARLFSGAIFACTLFFIDSLALLRVVEEEVAGGPWSVMWTSKAGMKGTTNEDIGSEHTQPPWSSP